MPITVSHALSATTPDDPAYEIRPSHWNSAHLATLSATAGNEIFGAFSNDPTVNVSFSTNAGGQIIASANVTAAPSPVNVTGANGSSVNAQTIAFSQVNGITLGVSTAANGATVTGSHNALTSQSNQSITAANGGFAFQTLSFSNLNGISFGTSAGSAITASHNALTTAAQSNQVVNSFNGSTGQITVNVGSSLSSSTNGSSITFGLASNITTALQPAGAYLTTARASNDAVGLNTAQSNVTWTVNSSGISVDARGYAGTTTAITGAASMTLNSDGLRFNGAALAGTSSGFTGANISASITHNTAGLALSMSVAAPGGGAFSAGVSNGGNTSGDTGVTGTRLVFAGGNNVTLSQATDANGATITFSGANAGGAQTGISGIQVSDATYTSGTVTWRNANGISFGSSGANGITASYTVPAATSWTVSDSATSATVGRLAFTASNGLTLTLSTSNNGNHTVIGSYTVPTVTNSSMSVSDAATSGTLARLAFTNLNGITLSLSTGAGGSHTIVGSHNALTSQSNQNVTAGNGGFAFQTLSFSNVNNFSFGTSAGSAITGSFSQSVQTVGLYATGNTTNNSSTTFDARTAGTWNALGAMTIGFSNGSVQVSAPATSSLVGTTGLSVSSNGSTISVFPIAKSEWNNALGLAIANAQQGNSLVSIQSFALEWPVVFSNAAAVMSLAGVGSAANNSTAYLDVTLSAVFYTRNASTLSSVASMSGGHTATWTSNATATMSGNKQLTATFAGTTLTPGTYWVALHVSTNNTATGGANTTALGNTISMVLGAALSSTAQPFGLWPNQTNDSVGAYSGVGMISTGATLATLAMSSITVTGTRFANANALLALRNATYQ